ncbi:MAG: DUF3784 domain-containing protein [Clostridia bacterium]|nr:DUF3784 domain-containing protein [Clostridia bacterium]
MAELIWAMISGVLAVACLIISVMQFNEKGLLFNNAYIWASKLERETMDKKPYYRQSGIAFALCAAIFFCMALECILLTGWLWLIIGALAIVVLIYAIVSSMKEQNK